MTSLYSRQKTLLIELFTFVVYQYAGSNRNNNQATNPKAHNRVYITGVVNLFVMNNSCQREVPCDSTVVYL